MKRLRKPAETSTDRGRFQKQRDNGSNLVVRRQRLSGRSASARTTERSNRTEASDLFIAGRKMRQTDAQTLAERNKHHLQFGQTELSPVEESVYTTPTGSLRLDRFTRHH